MEELIRLLQAQSNRQPTVTTSQQFNYNRGGEVRITVGNNSIALPTGVARSRSGRQVTLQ